MSQSITCPCGCNYSFIPEKEVSTPRSRKGAKEVDNWDSWKPMHMKLMAWGISGEWAKMPLSKDEIHKGFGGTTVDGINARICELWRKDVVERVIDKAPKNPDDNPHKSKMVKYRLNLGRAIYYLNNGGKLR